MKVLLIGDSYGLPRFCKEGLQVALTYEETYPELLRRKLTEFYGTDLVLAGRCQHANTANSLVSGEANMLAFLAPDYVIIQLGLSDLWPSSLRNAKPLQAELEGKDPWVTKERYEQYLSWYCDYAISMDCRVILVNIPSVPKVRRGNHQDIEAAIKSYNQALERIAVQRDEIRLINLFQVSVEYQADIFGDDDIHLNRVGSKLLAWQLAEAITEWDKEL